MLSYLRLYSLYLYMFPLFDVAVNSQSKTAVRQMMSIENSCNIDRQIYLF